MYVVPAEMEKTGGVGMKDRKRSVDEGGLQLFYLGLEYQYQKIYSFDT